MVLFSVALRLVPSKISTTDMLFPKPFKSKEIRDKSLSLESLVPYQIEAVAFD